MFEHGHDMLFSSGILHFLLRGHVTYKSFLGKPSPLVGHEIPYSFLIKLLILYGHAIY